jgi:hypothetical protein
LKILNDVEYVKQIFLTEIDNNMDYTCIICYDDNSELISSVNKIVLTPCGHPYHLECITTWIKSGSGHLDCPYCRCDLVSTI